MFFVLLSFLLDFFLGGGGGLRGCVFVCFVFYKNDDFFNIKRMISCM